MAPIFTAAVGITPQIIDDERLCKLRNDLFDVELKIPLRRSYSSSEEILEPLDINRLISILKPWKTWVFEEQVSVWNEPFLCCKKKKFKNLKQSIFSIDSKLD